MCEQVQGILAPSCRDHEQAGQPMLCHRYGYGVIKYLVVRNTKYALKKYLMYKIAGSPSTHSGSESRSYS